MLFDSLESLGRLVLVAVCAYAGLILVLRVAGKRSLAKLNAFDFAITVAFGSTLATVLLSKDVPLAEGLLAFVLLAGLQFAVSRGSIASRWFRRLVRSQPRLLVEDGRYLDAELSHERITRSEVDAAIRKQGIGRIEAVAAVVLETDGCFSVIRRDGSEPMTALRSVGRLDEEARRP
jgi:uncharacterized membrane protein YcaP (DUF421 family)